MYMKSNTGEIEVFLCPEYNSNSTGHLPQSQLRPYISQVSSVIIHHKSVILKIVL